jgi:hypothetical protein
VPDPEAAEPADPLASDPPPEHTGGPEHARPRVPPRPVSGVILVGIAVSIWWPAFTLGAWGTFFFDQMLTVWAAATAAFFVVLFQPRPSPHRWFRAAVLLVPSLWLALSFAPDTESSDVGALLVDLLAILAAIIGIPFTIWTLARIMWPEFGEHVSRGRLVLALGAVVLIAVLSWGLGANQSKFLTCGDFTISGNSEPPHCAKPGQTPDPIGAPIGESQPGVTAR